MSLFITFCPLKYHPFYEENIDNVCVYGVVVVLRTRADQHNAYPTYFVVVRNNILSPDDNIS
jgi:hypothetical protein